MDEAKRMAQLGKVLSAIEVADGTPGALVAVPPVRTNDDVAAAADDANNLAAALSVGATAIAKMAALDELTHYVDSIDNAKDLFVVGGFGPLVKCVTSEHSSDDVRVAAAGALSTVLQNNPLAQKWAMDAGTLTVLIGALQRVSPAVGGSSEGRSSSVRAAVLTALSSLVRDNADGQAGLLAGFDGLGLHPGDALSLLAAPVLEWAATCSPNSSSSSGQTGELSPAARSHRRLCRKSLFFLRHLLGGTSSGAVAAACASRPASPGIVPALLTVLRAASPALPSPNASTDGLLLLPLDDADSADTRDHALHILSALVSPPVEGIAVVDDSGDRRKITGGITLGAPSPSAAGVSTSVIPASAAASAVAPAADLSLGDVSALPPPAPSASAPAVAPAAEESSSHDSAPAVAPAAAAFVTCDALMLLPEKEVAAIAPAARGIDALRVRRAALCHETEAEGVLQRFEQWALDAAEAAVSAERARGDAVQAYAEEAQESARAFREEAALARSIRAALHEREH